MSETTHFAVVDEVEDGEFVVLFDAGPKVVLPAKMLPGGAGEGKVLKVTFAIDEEERERRTSEIRALQEKLLKRTRGER